MILMLRLALVGLTLHQIGVPPGQTEYEGSCGEKSGRSQRCELFRGPGFEIEDRGGGTEGFGVEFGVEGGEVGTTVKGYATSDKKGRIKGEEDVRCRSSQIRELSAELIVEAGVWIVGVVGSSRE
jgi:hypothetical protein